MIDVEITLHVSIAFFEVLNFFFFKTFFELVLLDYLGENYVYH